MLTLNIQFDLVVSYQYLLPLLVMTKPVPYSWNQWLVLAAYTLENKSDRAVIKTAQDHMLFIVK